MRTTSNEISFLCAMPKLEDGELDYSNAFIYAIKKIKTYISKKNQFAMTDEDFQKVNDTLTKNGFNPHKCYFKIFENIDEIMSDCSPIEQKRMVKTRTKVKNISLQKKKESLKQNIDDLNIKSWNDEELATLTCKLQDYYRIQNGSDLKKDEVKTPSTMGL